MYQMKTKDADEAAFLWTLEDFDLKTIEKVDGYRKKVVYA